jgi:hypothetical protein
MTLSVNEWFKSHSHNKQSKAAMLDLMHSKANKDFFQALGSPRRNQGRSTYHSTSSLKYKALQKNVERGGQSSGAWAT